MRDEDRLLTFEDLQACAVLPGRLDPVQGHRYVLGVDLAVRNDNAVIAVAHAEPVDDYADRRVVVDSLDVFSPSKHRENDLRAVEECVRARSGQYNGAPAVFDPSQAFQMMQQLRASGLTVHEHTHSAQSNSRRALLLLELVRGRRLQLPDDQETVAEFAGVKLRETSPGVYRYDHESGKHDDRVTAVSLAALHLLEDLDVDLSDSRTIPKRAFGRRRRARVNGIWTPAARAATGAAVLDDGVLLSIRQEAEQDG